MSELLRLNSGASYGSATVISPLCDRNGRALSIAGVPSCLEHPASSVVTCLIYVYFANSVCESPIFCTFYVSVPVPVLYSYISVLPVLFE